MKTIEIVPYDTHRPAIFEDETGKIKAALGDNLHHIGSVSVPGLAVKPIIDIIVPVNNYERIIPLLKSIGFESRGEMHLSFRSYFRKGKKINLHAYENSSPELKLNLCFRNYLGLSESTDFFKVKGICFQNFYKFYNRFLAVGRDPQQLLSIKRDPELLI